MQRDERPVRSGGKPELDRKAVMARFGAPRRGVPRRPGAVSARFIDRPTSLPNRQALMAEMDFALSTYPDHVGLVLIQVSGLPNAGPTGTPDPTSALVAAAARLRKAVRPTDLVARTSTTELGAVLWSLERPDLIDVVMQRVRRAYAEAVVLPGAATPLVITVGAGTSAPGSTAAEALGRARDVIARSQPLRHTA